MTQQKNRILQDLQFYYIKYLDISMFIVTMIHEILQNGRKSLHHNYSPGIRDETIVAAFFRPPFEH